MTATTTPAARVNVFVGSGRKVHVAYTAHNGQASTVCGAERRGVGVTYTRKTDAAVTCLACAPTTAKEATQAGRDAALVNLEANSGMDRERPAVADDRATARRRPVAAQATRDEVTVTVDEDTAAPRFFTARSAGRYRVFEVLADGTEIERAVVASKAKGAEKVAKLEAEAAPTAPLEVVTLDGEETSVEVTATPAKKGPSPEAVAKAVKQLQEELTANADAIGAVLSEPLPGEETPAPAAKPESDTKAYRIGKVLRDFILEHPADYDAIVVDHLATRNVCYDGTATLRVSFQAAAELTKAAKDLEASATAPWALMAARSAQKTLAKLFAGATV